MKRIVYGSESSCPKCNGFLTVDIDVGDGFRYDNCGGYDGCGFKRKKNLDGEEVDIRSKR